MYSIELEMDSSAKDTVTVERRSSEDFEQPRPKRARVALACQRCRARKQKCDGAQDSCSTCTRLGLRCHYNTHLAPKPVQKKLYIAALEDRVAELESFLSNLGHDSVGDDHWKDKQDQYQDDTQTQEDSQTQEDIQTREDPQTQELETLLGALRELVSSASSNFEGGNSSRTLGRVLGSVIKTQTSPKSGFSAEEEPSREEEEAAKDDDSPKSVPRAELVKNMGPMFVSPAVATRLLDGWIKHLSTRYPVIHTPRLRELHARRDESLDMYEESILHLVYANSGRILETIGETDMYFADQHYEAALQHMDEVLELRDTRAISYLLLMALYCVRGPREPGAWTLAGLAMRLCIELGLHRKASRNEEVTVERELGVRIFWSCYYLDREVSIAMARPPAISDNDMDAELPLDIDEDVDDLEVFERASKNITDDPVSPPSSLTPFIHFIRLRKIESKIEHVIYRVDRQTQTTPAIIQGFLDELHAWKRAIPPEYNDRIDTRLEPYNGIDIFMVLYYKCVRLLLYPQLSKPNLNLLYLKMCAEACAGVCEAYKRLHRNLKADYSPLTLQSVFLAGLTLIYCTWLAPRNYLDVMGAISDCNIMLYVMTERWPPARKYRDVFERIKMNVTDVIAQGNHQATRAAGILDAEMMERCRALDQGLPGGARTDYSQMISDMAKGKRMGPDMRAGSTGQQIRSSSSLLEHGNPSQSVMSPSNVMDFGNGHGNGNAHGAFIESALMYSLDNFGALTTEWDFSILDNSTSLNF